MAALQNDATHVVIHPYAGDAVGSIGKGSAEWRCGIDHMSRRDGAELRFRLDQPPLEILEDPEDLLPFLHGLFAGRLEAFLLDAATFARSRAGIAWRREPWRALEVPVGRHETWETGW